MGRIHVAVRETPLSCDAALAFLDDPSHGAVCTFVGRVRNTNQDKPVDGVSYDAFDALATHTLRTIAEEIQSRWGEDLDVWLEHFRGHLPVGGVSVVVAVASGHRAESFAACRHAIEEIKRRAPVWKEEHYTDGDSTWIEGRALRS